MKVINEEVTLGSTDGTIKIAPSIGSTGETGTKNYMGMINGVTIFCFEDNGTVIIYDKEMEKDATLYERFIRRHYESELIKVDPPRDSVANEITLSIDKGGEWEKILVLKEKHALVRGEITTDGERILATMREFLDYWEEVKRGRDEKSLADGQGQGDL